MEQRLLVSDTQSWVNKALSFDNLQSSTRLLPGVVSSWQEAVATGATVASLSALKESTISLMAIPERVERYVNQASYIQVSSRPILRHIKLFVFIIQIVVLKLSLCFSIIGTEKKNHCLKTCSSAWCTQSIEATSILATRQPVIVTGWRKLWRANNWKEFFFRISRIPFQVGNSANSATFPRSRKITGPRFIVINDQFYKKRDNIVFFKQLLACCRSQCRCANKIRYVPNGIGRAVSAWQVLCTVHGQWPKKMTGSFQILE